MTDTPRSAGGPLPSPVLHHAVHRLSYQDTDAAGILYFAAWFPKMEALVSEFMFLNGYRQDRSHAERGWMTVTRAATGEYLAAARLYDRIDVSMRIGRIGRTSFELAFDMHRLDDGVDVGRGSITLVLTDLDQRSIEIPSEFRRQLETWAA